MGIRMALLDRDRLPELLPALPVAANSAESHAERIAHREVAGLDGENFLEALDRLALQRNVEELGRLSIVSRGEAAQ